MSEITIPYEPSLAFDPSKYTSKDHQIVWNVQKTPTPVYVILKHGTSRGLENLVNSYLNQGLELVGGICCSRDQIETEYCQAMIKRF